MNRLPSSKKVPWVTSVIYRLALAMALAGLLQCAENVTGRGTTSVSSGRGKDMGPRTNSVNKGKTMAGPSESLMDTFVPYSPEEIAISGSRIVDLQYSPSDGWLVAFHKPEWSAPKFLRFDSSGRKLKEPSSARSDSANILEKTGALTISSASVKGGIAIKFYRGDGPTFETVITDITADDIKGLQKPSPAWTARIVCGKLIYVAFDKTVAFFDLNLKPLRIDRAIAPSNTMAYYCLPEGVNLLVPVLSKSYGETFTFYRYSAGRWSVWRDLKLDAGEVGGRGGIYWVTQEGLADLSSLSWDHTRFRLRRYHFYPKAFVEIINLTDKDPLPSEVLPVYPEALARSRTVDFADLPWSLSPADFAWQIEVRKLRKKYPLQDLNLENTPNLRVFPDASLICAPGEHFIVYCWNWKKQELQIVPLEVGVPPFGRDAPSTAVKVSEDTVLVDRAYLYSFPQGKPLGLLVDRFGGKADCAWPEQGTFRGTLPASGQRRFIRFDITNYRTETGKPENVTFLWHPPSCTTFTFPESAVGSLSYEGAIVGKSLLAINLQEYFFAGPAKKFARILREGERQPLFLEFPADLRERVEVREIIPLEHEWWVFVAPAGPHRTEARIWRIPEDNPEKSSVVNLGTEHYDLFRHGFLVDWATMKGGDVLVGLSTRISEDWALNLVQLSASGTIQRYGRYEFGSSCADTPSGFYRGSAYVFCPDGVRILSFATDLKE